MTPAKKLKRSRPTRAKRTLDSSGPISHVQRLRRSQKIRDTQPRDPVQEFADRIIAELEKGIKPWVRPLDADKAGGPQGPLNPVTGKHYHGINVLILGMDIRAFQSGDPRWMTYGLPGDFCTSLSDRDWLQGAGYAEGQEA